MQYYGGQVLKGFILAKYYFILYMNIPGKIREYWNMGYVGESADDSVKTLSILSAFLGELNITWENC